jgi:hypothetical protein
MNNETLKQVEKPSETDNQRVATETGKTATQSIEYELPDTQISGLN